MSDSSVCSIQKRPSILQLIGLFALVFFFGFLFSRLGLLKPQVSLGVGIGVWAVFMLGLVAASSSCIAVCGGLLLSSAAKFNERYRSATRLGHLRPVTLFIVGRLISYGILGGLIGLLGKALSLTPLVTGLITIFAALYMFVMGLEMLQLAPRWLKRCTPRIPNRVAHRIIDAEGKEHPIMPVALGAATFFLPCGFTQALQLYALTTGNFLTSASLLFAFALGTAPALFALGWASSSLKGKLGNFFFQFSGALVIVLGLWNIQNGFTMAGYPLSLPNFGTETVQASQDPYVTYDGESQSMQMIVDANYVKGYLPNRFTIRAGVPTRWEIDASRGAGCLSVLQSRPLGIRHLLTSGINTIAFIAPSKPGTYPFTCSMGMFRGEIIVVPNS
ncbi:MAG: sulfite exporter TauE/SafE family protein [Candidatus Uhrbacteria bacterium]|nr:sulfite exporter TauE/SafE family protein [Candidatus Uhrbacteria bacterium]